MDHELGSLLARWHQWRQRWTPERGFARAQWMAPAGLAAEADDEAFEALLMGTMEAEIEAMHPQLRLALQHVARAECLGVEVLTVHALLQHERRNTLIAHAIRHLRQKLIAAGIIL